MTDILVIPDVHATPSCGRLDHLEAAGWLALQRRPQVIVILGDWWDLPSLSIYDGARSVGGTGGGKRFEGKRLKADIAAGAAALEAFLGPIRAFNERQRRNRHADRVYQPIIYFVMGNHEERIARVPEHIPELDGIIGLDDIRREVESRGLTWVSDRYPLEIEGCLFAHQFASGTTGRPVQISQFKSKTQRYSYVWGHSHIWGTDAAHDALGGRRFGICAGVFKPEDRTRYEKGEWSGLTYLHNLRDGEADIEQISIQRLLSSRIRRAA